VSADRTHRSSITRRPHCQHHAETTASAQRRHTLNRLSCSTRLMAASSPVGESFVWKTTPKEPFPTILHWVYVISRVSPVKPSWTFSWITSKHRQQKSVPNPTSKIERAITRISELTPHPQSRELCRSTLRHDDSPLTTSCYRRIEG